MSTDVVRTWKALWDGDYSVAASLIDPGIQVHASMADGSDGSEIKGVEGMVGWIGQIRGPSPDLTFEIEVGPIAQDNLIALRWRATGTYAGGFPGANAPAGTQIDFTGIDILRVRDGRVVEYWLNSDMQRLFRQLHVQG
ncbi:hypothetical protein GCM10022251_67680 [Phytohabitans flavus]|uniref:SnoaL-like domain-containing protein n=1 Tax=Phytohabitans flavus TaxID=1076124 RepID=A0A6F8Y541_9ACTN|nr:ester cyclase [Phytohabitans flavus]BCB81177.1 hypothetical protein Pflav_075870 [Phytohabitans flavus]